MEWIEKDNNNNSVVNVQNNFLPEEAFKVIEEQLNTVGAFPWYYNYKMVSVNEAQSPGQLVHLVYADNVPQSSFYEYDPIIAMRKRLRIGLLIRIKMNLYMRLPEPFYSEFHTDVGFLSNLMIEQYTTSIFYINTCNGYTEFENGEKVESVRNRLVSFPSDLKHRGVSQTDTQVRYVINFNYLKRDDADE